MYDIYKTFTKTTFKDVRQYWWWVVFESCEKSWKATGGKKFCFISGAAFLVVLLYQYYVEKNLQEVGGMITTALITLALIGLVFSTLCVWNIIVTPVTHYRLIIQSKVTIEIINALNNLLKEGVELKKSEDENLKNEWIETVRARLKRLPEHFLDMFDNPQSYSHGIQISIYAMNKRIDPNSDAAQFEEKLISLRAIKEMMIPYSLHGGKSDNT